jgi:hypothetical protein
VAPSFERARPAAGAVGGDQSSQDFISVRPHDSNELAFGVHHAHRGNRASTDRSRSSSASGRSGLLSDAGDSPERDGVAFSPDPPDSLTEVLWISCGQVAKLACSHAAPAIRSPSGINFCHFLPFPIGYRRKNCSRRCKADPGRRLKIDPPQLMSIRQRRLPPPRGQSDTLALLYACPVRRRDRKACESRPLRSSPMKRRATLPGSNDRSARRISPSFFSQPSASSSSPTDAFWRLRSSHRSASFQTCRSQPRSFERCRES